MPHTPRYPSPSLCFPTPWNCSTIFFLETCVNYRRKEEEEGGGCKGNVGGLCMCVRGHPPRLSRDLHRNVHTFFWLLPPPMPPSASASGCLFLCLFCFLASSVTNFDACLIRYATISFSFAMLSPVPLFPHFPLSLPLL